MYKTKVKTCILRVIIMCYGIRLTLAGPNITWKVDRLTWLKFVATCGCT